MRGRACTALLAGLLLLASCARVEPGAAVFPPGAQPVTKGPFEDPCVLLSEEQLAELGLAAGEFTEANPKQRVPQGCDFRSADPDLNDNTLTLVISDEMSIAEYRGIDTPPDEEFELAGRTWGRYVGVFGEEACHLMLPLGESSFVALLSLNLTDKAKACDLPKVAAPMVGENLP
ncbi:Protein of unknown function [Amycolatopsis marina]|uniref:DUF3558 domain-containing protein n=1 Tax=Amycolatopsis marina TaxID=490629 RepID=A0A1I0WAT4_9PSEU|nr:DUF3558 domain-containing protein [Amycolatopsis marina]SFA85123.1 Protein of unknown function [Amycolatopsis marina]